MDWPRHPSSSPRNWSHEYIKSICIKSCLAFAINSNSYSHPVRYAKPSVTMAMAKNGVEVTATLAAISNLQLEK